MTNIGIIFNTHNNNFALSDEQKRLRSLSDLIEPAIVEINLKRNKVRLIFTRCEDAANLYDFNSRFNDNVKTL